jgi:hypothetical protein
MFFLNTVQNRLWQFMSLVTPNFFNESLYYQEKQGKRCKMASACFIQTNKISISSFLVQVILHISTGIFHQYLGNQHIFTTLLLSSSSSL